MTGPHRKLLEGAVARRLTDPARAWFAESMSAVESGADVPTCLALAARRASSGQIEIDPEEAERLDTASVRWVLDGVSLSEGVRVMLLLRAIGDQPAERAEPLLAECFRLGDNPEKRAVLRVLSLVREPERMADLAAQGCRTNVESVFSGLCCDNPYPARHLTEAAFNQMVLKAVFIGVRVERIIDLDRRLNPDLARMARDYEAERRAAGRSVPEDIERLV